MKKLFTATILSLTLLTQSFTSNAAPTFSPSSYNFEQTNRVTCSGSTYTFHNDYYGDFSIDFSQYSNIVDVIYSSTGFNILYRNASGNTSGYMYHWGK